MADFEDLVREAEQVPVESTGFEWLDGRGSEGRPPWGYQRMAAQLIRRAHTLLDLQTGRGDVTAGALKGAGMTPSRVVATESVPEKAKQARRVLEPYGAEVVECPVDRVPLPDASFDLVIARHPEITPWQEVARVLTPGGTFLSQQVGRGSVRELTMALMGTADAGAPARSAEDHLRQAREVGLEVKQVETASLPVTFNDIAAIVVFLRKVIWAVPGFSVDAFRDPLRRMHDHIQSEGPFRATSERYLIEVRRPD